MAESVLKYDDSYKEALVYPDDKLTDVAAADSSVDTEDPDSAETTDSTDTETNKDAITPADNNETVNSVEDVDSKETDTSKYKASNMNLSEEMGKGKFEISYSNYYLCDSYPNESKNNNFTIESSKDRQLLVITFDIKNLSDKAEKLDLIEAGFDYKLVNADGTREFLLKPGDNSVGRENADILLADNTVSRRHAKVVVADGSVAVEDAGSTNGTCVAGQRLAAGERIVLTDGCDISFGAAVLKYVAPEPVENVSAESEDDAPAEDAVADEMAIEVTEQTQPVETDSPASEDTEAVVEEPRPAEVGKLVSKDGSHSFALIEGVNTLGRRSGDNTIVISDPYCSGRHADITVKEGSIVLTDIGSTNGTVVNGVKLESNIPRELVQGDEIAFGQIVFKVEVA
jgi:pSer/pThr/pTyr-binding forkhead associated (FHA) protein